MVCMAMHHDMVVYECMNFTGLCNLQSMNVAKDQQGKDAKRSWI